MQIINFIDETHLKWLKISMGQDILFNVLSILNIKKDITDLTYTEVGYYLLIIFLKKIGVLFYININ